MDVSKLIKINKLYFRLSGQNAENDGIFNKIFTFISFSGSFYIFIMILTEPLVNFKEEQLLLTIESIVNYYLVSIGGN